MLMPGFVGHIDSWLAIARHEKIDNLEKPNGYNSCNAHLCLFTDYKLDTLSPLSQGAKIGCFIFVCLFSMFGIVSIHIYLGTVFPGER